MHGTRILGTPHEGVNRELTTPPAAGPIPTARAGDARVAVEAEAPAPLDTLTDADA